MEKLKKSIDEIEADMDISLTKYNKYQELKDSIMIHAEKWKQGEVNDRDFQEQIYDCIDSFIKKGKWSKPNTW